MTASVLIHFSPFLLIFKQVANDDRVTYQGHKDLYTRPQMLQLLSGRQPGTKLVHVFSGKGSVSSLL